jgi:serine/threonine protein kinase
MVLISTRSNNLFSTLAPGAMFRQCRLLEQIGVGGQGMVWSALDAEQKRILAIKFAEIPESDEGEAEDLRDQRQLSKLVGLQHAHILPVLDYGFEEGARFTVTPYVAGGILTHKIKAAPLLLYDVLRYGMEIASALDYLHARGIIHRDLKSSNILLDLHHRSYLADFGLARTISTSTLAFHTGHGTPPYSPPEQVQMKAITPRSDIYSFGILLYEMFTGQLPWNGKRQLGMEQLSTKLELPDPRELNPNLPPLLKDVLRRVTSADPALRPRTAGEIMRAICHIFRLQPELFTGDSEPDGSAPWSQDAGELLEHVFSQWQSTDGEYNPGLTKFALLDLQRETINLEPYRRFMLTQSLNYGYNDEYWWQTVRDPQERLAVSSELLRRNNQAISGRILLRLTEDPQIRSASKGLPENILQSLLETGIRSDNAFFRQQVFNGMRSLTRPRVVWEDQPYDPKQLKRLGELALEDSEFGDTAAELIGHIHSPSAVKHILDHADDDRKFAALLTIQKAAGGLPAFVERNVRIRLALEWVLYRVIQQPASLVGAYLLALLGATLGVGVQVYLTYNLPDFLDIARITTSLEQGLIVGAIFGLGIFVTRVAVERFSGSAPALRLLLGTVAGAVGMNIALLVFHVLFLNTPPRGFSITAGCALMALTFALGGLLRPQPLRMALASAAVFAAIIGTWLIHVNYAASLVDLTPIFRYDSAWSLTQISLTALGVALPIGILGNLVDLSVVEE